MLKIAIQGIETSFHEVAAKKYFGENITSDECWTFTELCESLNSGKSDFAVMAIENSIAGSLLQNYGLLQDYHFYILGEVFLRIEMNLMALPGTKLEEISVVQSHPIAIRQCMQFLQNLPNIKILEKEDTAACAKEIAELNLKGYAAIANKAAAPRFGLEILASNIETNKNNFTRFMVLGKKPLESDKNNKATLFFNLPHDPGSLAKVLNLFAEHNINLTKIQSVPIVGLPYKYNFHVDIEWQNYSDYQKAKKAILPFIVNLSILGEYQKGDFDSIRNID
jgi:prephenate dehydratase